MQETTYSDGSMSTSIASAASFNQFLSWFSFLTTCWAFSISLASASRCFNFGKNPDSIDNSGISVATPSARSSLISDLELTSTKRLHECSLGPLLLGRAEQECKTRFLSTGRSTRSMDIRIGRSWEIEMNDMFDEGNIETPSSYIRCDQDSIR